MLRGSGEQEMLLRELSSADLLTRNNRQLSFKVILLLVV
jgi:hypothetical protein